MYFARIAPATGELLELRMTPTRIRRFRVNRASQKDTSLLRDILNREGARFGGRVELQEDGHLRLTAEG